MIIEDGKMVTLRELRKEDAKLMLEWMHDKKIQASFKKNMMDITLEKAEEFCINARIPEEICDGLCVHFAIVDENDEYLGTISLKNIDLYDERAEYAIALRPSAHNRGVAYEATMKVLSKAFDEYNLHRVYLTVVETNHNAIKLYEKCGFTYEGELRSHIKCNGIFVNWKLYGLIDDEFRNLLNDN